MRLSSDFVLNLSYKRFFFGISSLDEVNRLSKLTYAFVNFVRRVEIVGFLCNGALSVNFLG